MKNICILLFIVMCGTLSAQSLYIKGADLSYLQEIEQNGGVFTSSGTPADALTILKANGINCIRLRLWNNPSAGYNSLAKTIQMAGRIKQQNLAFLLDFHYSDYWADPSRQTKPSLWSTLSFQALSDSVASFTSFVLSSLKAQNLLPDYIQFGNEITAGFLWNEGRVGGAYDTPIQWTQFTSLLKKAIESADLVYNGVPYKKIIHIDRGADAAGAQWFFDKLVSYSVPFDIIGLSYYPWWHGTLTQLTQNLSFLAQRYNKEVLVAETAYPWTLNWADTTNNLVGLTSQLLPGYNATVGGQKLFLQAVLSIVANVSGNKGAGICYWAPDAITTATRGSDWENLALFNFSGEILGSAAAFATNTAVEKNEPGKDREFLISNFYPNPVHSVTKFNLQGTEAELAVIELFTSVGERVVTFQSRQIRLTKGSVEINTSQLTPGVYFAKIYLPGMTVLRSFVKI